QSADWIDRGRLRVRGRLLVSPLAYQGERDRRCQRSQRRQIVLRERTAVRAIRHAYRTENVLTCGNRHDGKRIGLVSRPPTTRSLRAAHVADAQRQSAF